MKMDLDELAALDAAGALTADERRAFEEALAAAPADVRAEVAAFREAALAIAEGASCGPAPSADVRDRLLSRIDETNRPVGQGFSFRFAKDDDDDWQPHPVPGIRMKVLAQNVERGYSTLLLEVQPGARFPPHHHDGAEECYVLSGSLYTCGRRLSAGDFLHADPNTDHGEIWTEEGCRVLLVVPLDDEIPPDQATSA
ncbi:MAG TPA: cupin domain-containing protein [Vicinamibacterales bacterium]|nr:cupin domain-containing protein [Vicinamibacterales bacterium]